MERYSRFRDPATGIAPFNPVPRSSRPRFGDYVVAVLSFLVYLCILPISLVSFKFYVRRLLSLLKVQINMRFLQIDEELATRSSRTKTLLSSRSVLVCNHTSPLDIAIISQLCNAAFTSSDTDTAKVACLSHPQAFRCAYDLRYKLRSFKDSQDLSFLVKTKTKSKTIVLFPEGTTTNGQGILKLCPSVENIPSNLPVQLAFISYSAPCATSPDPTTSFIKYIWNILVYRKPIKATVIVTDPLTDAQTRNPDMALWIARMFTNMSNVRELKLSLHDKIEYDIRRHP